MSAFSASLDLGAGIECDLRLTSDNQIVVFHDADARRLCGSDLRIGSASLEQVQRLKVGQESIPTFGSLLDLVGRRVPMLLEAKVDRDIFRWVPALRRDLAAYAGPFGVMSFDPRLSRLLKAHMPNVRRGLVIRDNLAPVQRRLALRLADPQFVSVETHALGKPWVEQLRKRVPVYTWTVRTAAARVQGQVHADALIWEADGRPRN